MEQQQETTPPGTEEQPKAEAQQQAEPQTKEPAKPQEPVIALKAYQGLQREYQKLHDAKVASERQMEELKATTEYLSKSTSALVKSTLGDEKAAALDAELASARTLSQRKAVEAAAIEFSQKQADLLYEALQVSGIDPASIEWPQNAKTPGEWYDAAREQVIGAVTAQQRRLIKAVETAQAKAAKDAEAKAEELANKKLKEAGVGKIDTGKGGATTGLSRLESMDPTSKEFRELVELATKGKLTKI